MRRFIFIKLIPLKLGHLPVATVWRLSPENTHDHKKIPPLLIVLIAQHLIAACSQLILRRAEPLPVETLSCVLDCSPVPRDPLPRFHSPALLRGLSIPRPVLLEQLLRARPNSWVLILEGQDQRIDRARRR